MIMNFFMGVLRLLVQTSMPTLIVWAAKYNISFGPEVQDWIANGLIYPAAMVLYTSLVHWLENRDSGFAHFLARILMLGINQQPTYNSRDSVSDGNSREG
jgi:hypothetical protein